jgi:hypothetical protein
VDNPTWPRAERCALDQGNAPIVQGGLFRRHRSFATVNSRSCNLPTKRPPWYGNLFSTPLGVFLP